MPGRAKGNQRESTVAEELDKLSYFVISLKGSGARGARMRRRRHAVVGDLLAIRDRDGSGPWLQVEVGKHSAKSAFKALRAHPMPGFTPIFIQYHYPLIQRKRRRKGHGRVRGIRSKIARRRIFTDEHTSFSGLEAALWALKNH